MILVLTFILPTVICIISQPNDFRVSVEIDWDWELIVEVYNYEKGDNVANWWQERVNDYIKIECRKI